MKGEVTCPGPLRSLHKRPALYPQLSTAALERLQQGQKKPDVVVVPSLRNAMYIDYIYRISLLKIESAQEAGGYCAHRVANARLLGGLAAG